MVQKRDCLSTPMFFPSDVNMIKQKEYLKHIRRNVKDFIDSVPYDSKKTYLEIGPSLQNESFSKVYSNIETLDIDPSLCCTYTCDLTKEVPFENRFDFILCMEILEHTENPFKVIQNLHKALKPGGYIYVSTPFNFRMHSPLPDCFRISEYGLKSLLKNFEIQSLDCIYDEDVPYFPIHYTCIAKRLN
jgi:SAM-dependent methyltransferase